MQSIPIALLWSVERHAWAEDVREGSATGVQNLLERWFSLMSLLDHLQSLSRNHENGHWINQLPVTVTSAWGVCSEHLTHSFCAFNPNLFLLSHGVSHGGRRWAGQHGKKAKCSKTDHLKAVSWKQKGKDKTRFSQSLSKAHFQWHHPPQAQAVQVSLSSQEQHREPLMTFQSNLQWPAMHLLCDSQPSRECLLTALKTNVF